MHFIHEGISIDVKFHNFDQFLEFKEKTKDLNIDIATKNKERTISSEGIIKTIIVEKKDGIDNPLTI